MSIIISMLPLPYNKVPYWLTCKPITFWQIMILKVWGSAYISVTTLQTMWNSPTFPDGSRHSSAALGMLIIHTCMDDANMQLTINSFRQLFPDKIFSPDISMTFSKNPRHFPDSCRHFEMIIHRAKLLIVVTV